VTTALKAGGPFGEDRRPSPKSRPCQLRSFRGRRPSARQSTPTQDKVRFLGLSRKPGWSHRGARERTAGASSKLIVIAPVHQQEAGPLEVGSPEAINAKINRERVARDRQRSVEARWQVAEARAAEENRLSEAAARESKEQPDDWETRAARSGGPRPPTPHRSEGSAPCASRNRVHHGRTGSTSPNAPRQATFSVGSSISSAASRMSPRRRRV
jgi:hypothetical protein